MATRQGSRNSPAVGARPAPLPLAAAGGSGEGPADLKRSLLRRMGLAGLMILALLGALALFDYANAPDDSPGTGQQFTEPVPVRKKESVEPVTPVRPVTVADAPADASADARTVVPAVDRPAAASVTPPLANIAAAPAASGKTGPLGEPPPGPEVAARPALPPPARRPVEPSATAAGTQPAAGQFPGAPPLTAGYVLQSGMFADPGRAEEWQARLAQEGIPSTIEARLQIGPFASRAEAEAARRKMDRLGLETPGNVRRSGKP